MSRWSELFRPDSDVRPAYAFNRRTAGAAFEVTVPIGAWEIPIPWHASSIEDAREGFIEFLEDGDAVRTADPSQPSGIWRTVDVLFNGQPKQLTFRVDFIPGFTVK